ncbi:hypothetical protein CEUSTIGMA_g7107.t1 [Chlamydomonas eustigma]|uniref:Uncharacterized protein n=1 Tax=Chlamydomonas eustigma TaxID=1157962 RepID=A0A250X9B8_9CHLO|nr:hypothetical protein CEUSTIGMA_g7107.t1 [Chlamydomonas eustigma]|eukprot:GAX79666.1 hypothetical protein CEUSTIGMA_g7107.t1 [Chlamydomonas eustigma]
MPSSFRSSSSSNADDVMCALNIAMHGTALAALTLSGNAQSSSSPQDTLGTESQAELIHTMTTTARLITRGFQLGYGTQHTISCSLEDIDDLHYLQQQEVQPDVSGLSNELDVEGILKVPSCDVQDKKFGGDRVEAEILKVSTQCEDLQNLSSDWRRAGQMQTSPATSVTTTEPEDSELLNLKIDSRSTSAAFLCSSEQLFRVKPPENVCVPSVEHVSAISSCLKRTEGPHITNEGSGTGWQRVRDDSAIEGMWLMPMLEEQGTCSTFPSGTLGKQGCLHQISNDSSLCVRVHHALTEEGEGNKEDLQYQKYIKSEGSLLYDMGCTGEADCNVEDHNRDVEQSAERVSATAEEETPENMVDHRCLFQFMATELSNIHQRYLSRPAEDFEACLSPRRSRTSLEDMVTSSVSSPFGFQAAASQCLGNFQRTGGSRVEAQGWGNTHAPSPPDPNDDSGEGGSISRPSAKDTPASSLPDITSPGKSLDLADGATHCTGHSHAVREKEASCAGRRVFSPLPSLLERLVELQSELDNLVEDVFHEVTTYSTEAKCKMDQSSGLSDDSKGSASGPCHVERRLSRRASGSSLNSQDMQFTSHGEGDFLSSSSHNKVLAVSEEQILLSECPQLMHTGEPHTPLQISSRSLLLASNECNESGLIAQPGLHHQSTTFKSTEDVQDYSKAWGETRHAKLRATVLSLYPPDLSLRTKCGASSTAGVEEQGKAASTVGSSPTRSTGRILGSVRTPFRSINVPRSTACTSYTISSSQVSTHHNYLLGTYLAPPQQNSIGRSHASQVKFRDTAHEGPQFQADVWRQKFVQSQSFQKAKQMEIPGGSLQTDCIMLHNAVSISYRYLMPNSTIACAADQSFNGKGA